MCLVKRDTLTGLHLQLRYSGRVSRVGVFLVFLWVLVWGALSLAGQVAPAPSWQVRPEPETLVNGAPAILRVIPPIDLRNLSGSWLGHDLHFRFDSASRSWYGFFGVDITTAAGSYPLKLTGETAAGSPVIYEGSLQVSTAAYPTVTLTVQRKFVVPNKRQAQRVKKEEAIKHRAFARSSDQQLWSQPFMVPVNTAVSEVFGVNRVFNGKLQTRHLGLDFHASPGTPIVAANSGTVLLARRLYFEGRCVVVDHGQGLMTLYMHFSRLKVKEGQRVSRGQVLGLSGATGRVTGPHFHWSLRWEGTYLDPGKLASLNLP